MRKKDHRTKTVSATLYVSTGKIAPITHAAQLALLTPEIKPLTVARRHTWSEDESSNARSGEQRWK